jgi:hypothetical protein
MVENDYPKPGYQSVYPIDSEMVCVCVAYTVSYTYNDKRPQCLTANGKALTRACLVDYATNKVLDNFTSTPVVLGLAPGTSSKRRCGFAATAVRVEWLMWTGLGALLWLW